jgi:peptidyl-prolyl cis-trans isomerase A (cyclophilin A)
MLRHPHKALLFLFLLSTGLRAEDDGLFADFSTSLGDFTVELDYEAAPMTVANFIGLAEGSRPWVDPRSGRIRENTPFYNGLTFHRVIAGFMNQGGCPLGNGSGGPGYRFRDEVDNGLVHVPYVISMANSGSHTNGSQFFITVGTYSNLDGKHTVFGFVSGGQSVIDDINAVETANEAPIEPVIIETVTIRRVGAAADAFDGSNTHIPNVSGVRGEIFLDDVESTITFNVTENRPAPTYVRIFESTDLQEWTLVNMIYAADKDWEGHGINLGPKQGPRGFYYLARVDYSDALSSSEAALTNATLVFNWGNQSLTFNFDATGKGGTMEYFNGNELLPSVISDMINNSELWDGEWIILSEDFPPLGILGLVDSYENHAFGGPGELYQFVSDEWEFVSDGNFSLTLP